MDLCLPGHCNIMSWSLWTCCFYSRTAHEGDGNSKDPWRIGFKSCSPHFKRFLEAGGASLYRFSADSMVVDRSIPGAVSIPYSASVVVVTYCRHCSIVINP